MLRSDLDPAPALTSARGTGVGFAVAMQPVAAHTIVTDTVGLVAGEVTIKVGDFDLPAYRARPQGDGRFPIVVDRLRAPVLGLYGGADTGIPLDSVERMKAALAQGSDAARRSRFVVYPHAQHAFHADYRPNYDEAAARDGWQRCLDWMRANGVA